MFALYVFSLVLGGGFLLVSLLGGAHDSDVDLGGDVDVGGLDLHGDMDLHGGLDVHGDMDFQGDMDLQHDVDIAHDHAAARIFSLRTVVYGLFGFGATGLALTLLGMGPTASFLFALLGGGLAGALVSALFYYLRVTESGAQPTDRGLVGLTGTVTLPLLAESPGTVVVERGLRLVTLRALPHSSAHGDPESWTSVVVVEMDGGVARVAPLEGDELDALPGAPDD